MSRPPVPCLVVENTARPPVPLGAGVSIGRSARHAVQLPDGQVSGDHAEIRPEGGSWVLRDLGSTNGTRVNGKPVTLTLRLADGDCIEIGPFRLRVRGLEPLPSPGPEERPAPFTPPAWPPGLPAAPGAPFPSQSAVARPPSIPPPPPPAYASAVADPRQPIPPRPCPPPYGRPGFPPGLEPRPRKKGKAAAWIILSGAVLVAAGVFLWLFVLRPAPAPGPAADDRRHQTLDPVFPNTPAGSVEPAPGFRITWPANALDKAREFRIRKLEGPGFTDAARRIPAAVGLPVLAFDLDAGLKPEETLPGPVRVQLDLAALGVPREIWPELAVARLDPAGTPEFMSGRAQGGVLAFEARKNCPYVLSLLLGLVLAGGHVYENSKKFPGGAYKSDRLLEYNLYWPARMEAVNAAEVDRVARETEQVMVAHGWDPSTRSWTPPSGEQGSIAPPIWVARKWSALRADPDYQHLRELAGDPAWRRANVWPRKVALAAAALEKADRYLLKERKFRRPGYVMDVVLLDPWPVEYGADALGMEMDLATTYPFLHLNGQIDLSDNDELNMTVVHELFHALQKEYYAINRDSLLWFLEAAAVALEYEASAWYVKAGWNKRQLFLTDRDYWETFRYPLQDPAEDEIQSRRHGYTVSLFLEFLRDNPAYNPHGRDEFLPRLMNAFSGYLTGPVGALYGFASRKAKDLADQFLDFCRQRSPAMFANVRAKAAARPNEALLQGILARLSPAQPLLDWEYKKGAPLSTTFRAVSVADFPESARKDARIVLINGRSEAMTAWSVHHRVSTSVKTAWAEADDRCLDLPLSGADEVRLQRIEAFASTTWTSPDERLRLFVLVPPAKPELEHRADTLKVRIPAGPLRSLGLVDHYRVTVIPPGGGKPLTFTTRDGLLELDIREAEAKAGPVTLKDPKGKGAVTISAAEMQGIMDQMAYLQGSAPTYGVSCQEVVLLPAAPEPKPLAGPPSPAALAEKKGEAVGGVNVEGTWEGPVTLTSVTMTLVIEPGEAGYAVKLTQRLSGEPGSQVYFGKAAMEGGRQVYQLYVKEGSAYLGPMTTLHVLGPDTLAMFAPNVTLRRK